MPHQVRNQPVQGVRILAAATAVLLARSTSLRLAFALLFTGALSACVSNPPNASSPSTAAVALDRPVPAYLTQDKSCAVVAGGAIGSQFADARVTRFWHAVNTEITDKLVANLEADRYQVVKVLVPTEGVATQDRLITQQLAQARCNRLIQVSHTVGEDTKGKYFRFDVEVLRMAPKAGTAVQAQGTTVVPTLEFRRDYRFARTPDVFGTFDTQVFATTAYLDMRGSGKLESLRQP